MLFAGVDQAISQHQASFRIGVHHFDAFAVAIANNVAQLEGVAADHVVRTAKIELHALIQTTRNCQRQCTGDRGCSAHIRFHGIHECALLQAVTAGIKGDAFADQTGVNRFVVVASWIVIHRQQHRLAGRSTAYGVQAHIALRTQIVAFGNPVAYRIAALFADYVNRTLRQLLRPQLFCRQVNGVAYPVNDG